MPSPLRILHVCGTFPPDYGGGATETTREIARLQAASGHHVSILCAAFRPGAPYRVLEDLDGALRVLRVIVPDVFHQDPEGFHLPLGQRRRHEKSVRALIGSVVEKVQPDIVDYHVNRPLGEEALLAFAALRVPVVASLHDFWMICPRITYMRSPTDQPCSGPGILRCLLCVYSHYDGSIGAALPKLAWRVPKLGVGLAWKVFKRRLALRTVRGAMARSGALSDAHAPFITGSCAPILHGISIPEGAARHPSNRTGPLRFGFFGGNAGNKGLGDILKVVERLAEEKLRLELHVFGPGEVQPHPSVVVRGLFGSEEKGSAYSSIDVALMATRTVEPRGRIPEEAAFWGVPSIVPRIGGLVDVVRDEVDGLLYRFRDIGDLERQMRRVLLEAGLLERLRGSLRTPPQLRNSLEQIEAVYRRAITLAESDSHEDDHA